MPFLEVLYDYAGFIAIALLFGFMLLGVPVFVSMAMAVLLSSLITDAPAQVLRNFAQITWQGSSIFELVALPLFILTGTIMQRSEAGADLFAATKAWFGRVPNSLGVATISACTIFAAISGSSIATAATVGLVAIPLLQAEGYGDRRSGGFVAGGGTLGIIIPPSIPLILYGVLTETSIGKLFIAGIVPGLIMASLFAVYAMFSRPSVRTAHTLSLRERMDATKRGTFVLLLPAVIIASIYLGVFTPTEVGALSTLYVLVLGIAQRRLDGAKIVSAVVAAARTNCMLFMLIVFGQYFAHFLTFQEIPQAIANAIISFAQGPVAVSVMILVYVVLGMFLESAAMLLITVPIFEPVAHQLGMDPLVFGIFACIAMEIAQISPPIGVNLFTIHGISGIKLAVLSRGVLPFIAVQIIMLYVIFFFPALVTWLPSTMYAH
jgi:C4-dicarboxylate transporter DctM subunit